MKISLRLPTFHKGDTTVKLGFIERVLSALWVCQLHGPKKGLEFGLQQFEGEKAIAKTITIISIAQFIAQECRENGYQGRIPTGQLALRIKRILEQDHELAKHFA